MTLNFPGDTSQIYIDPNTGLKYIFNQSIGGWETAIQPPVVVSEDPPALNIPGFLWWDSTGGSLFVWYKDDDSEQWVEVVPTGGSQSAIAVVSPNPPADPRIGALWVDISDTSSPILKVYAALDNKPADWIIVSDPGSRFSGAYAGPEISTSRFAPRIRKQNDLWYSTLDNKLYFFKGDDWVHVGGEALCLCGI